MLKEKLEENGFVQLGSAWVHPQIENVIVVNPSPKTLIVRHLRKDRTIITETTYRGLSKAEAAIDSLIKTITRNCECGSLTEEGVAMCNTCIVKGLCRKTI